jgi:hypothetical protein
MRSRACRCQHGAPGAFRVGSRGLLHGRSLSKEAAATRGEAEVRGNREEGFDRADRTLLENTEGHARPAPAAAVGGGRPAGKDRAGPRPLRAPPTTSRSRWCDAGRDLLRSDAIAPFRNPASTRQAGRKPDGLAVPNRVPRCGTAVSGAGSKSSLKEGHESSVKGAGVGRRVRARTHRSGRGAGLCPPTATAIPIASQQVSRAAGLPVRQVLRPAYSVGTRQSEQ